jgi:hypothetical protein
MSISRPEPGLSGLPYAPQSPEGLAARWVQWLASFGLVNNPVRDTTGKQTARNQPEDVFFLAGTFGGEAERACRIPAWRPLFFPLFNMWLVDSDTPPPVLAQAYGSARVDGVDATAQPIATPLPFPVSGVWLNPVTRGRRPRPTTVSGLWARADGLAPGPHLVRFTGGYGAFSVAVTYHLTVA